MDRELWVGGGGGVGLREYTRYTPDIRYNSMTTFHEVNLLLLIYRLWLIGYGYKLLVISY